METLENRTYDEIAVGDTAEYRKLVTEQDVQLFAVLSGDVNPVHLDQAYAETTLFKGRIAHGMLTGAVVSAALGLKLPGPGTIYLNQELGFRKPVRIGDELIVHLEVTSKRDDKRLVSISCSVENQHGKVVAAGDALVMAPSNKIRMDAPPLPQIRIVDSA